jgi:hypothetical protein
LRGKVACRANGVVKIVRRVIICAEPELVWDVITRLHRAKEWTQGFEDYP